MIGIVTAAVSMLAFVVFCDCKLSSCAVIASAATRRPLLCCPTPPGAKQSTQAIQVSLVLHHQSCTISLLLRRASRPRPREQRTCLRRCNHRYRPRFSSPSHWTQSHHYPPSASRRPRRCHHHRPARCPPPHCLRRCWTHSPSQASPWPPQQCVGEVLNSLIFKSLLFSNDYALFKYNTYALTCIESFIHPTI